MMPPREDFPSIPRPVRIIEAGMYRDGGSLYVDYRDVTGEEILLDLPLRLGPGAKQVGYWRPWLQRGREGEKRLLTWDEASWLGHALRPFLDPALERLDEAIEVLTSRGRLSEQMRFLMSRRTTTEESPEMLAARAASQPTDEQLASRLHTLVASAFEKALLALEREGLADLAGVREKFYLQVHWDDPTEDVFYRAIQEALPRIRELFDEEDIPPESQKRWTLPR